MTLTIPKWLRITLYAITVVGTPVMKYLEAKGIVGSLEMTLFDAEVVVAGTVATLHVGSNDAPTDEPEPDPEPAAVSEDAEPAVGSHMAD